MTLDGVKKGMGNSLRVLDGAGDGANTRNRAPVALRRTEEPPPSQSPFLAINRASRDLQSWLTLLVSGQQWLGNPMVWSYAELERAAKVSHNFFTEARPLLQSETLCREILAEPLVSPETRKRVQEITACRGTAAWESVTAAYLIG